MGGVVHPSVLTYSARPSSGIVSVLSSVVTMTIVGRLHMSLSSLSPLVQSFPRASRISPLRQSERGMASRVHCCQPLSSVQFSRSGMSDFAKSPRGRGLQHARPVHHQCWEPTQTHVHWVSDAIQPSHPLSTLLNPPSNLPSIRVFSNESVLRIRWPKYQSFSFSISSSNEYSWFPSGWTGWISLQSKGLSRVFSNTS